MNRTASLARTLTSSTTRRALVSPFLSRPSSSSSSSSNRDNPLTHPALLSDPPAVTPTDPWSLTSPPPPPAPSPSLTYPTMEELLASPHPEGRDQESTEGLRKRLVYESRKRGILEMDLILGTFARERLGGMGDRELREYDRFLTLPDWSIFYYVTAKADPPEPWKSSWVLQELLDHARNKGRSVRRMPDLEEGKKA